MTKFDVLQRVKKDYITKNGLLMDDVDELKPWGAYYRFPLQYSDVFLEKFFPELGQSDLNDMSPKIMVFEPGKKISFQYHERRDEIWVVLEGVVEAYIGDGDELGDYKTYQVGDTFTYPAFTRHKAGASSASWAVIGEIWRHTDLDNKSTEEDNIRLSDDFGRV